ncbi:MAG: radical SAM protein [Hyphomicrobium sp.]|nr:radical SAM protein [Hyphomicrobium sp.]
MQLEDETGQSVDKSTDNNLEKFSDPDRTAKGETRASVPLWKLETLWINTGTLCNITCRNCYILSSPTNDSLVYLTAAEAMSFIREAKTMGAVEIGFTGGEPFLNPEILEMIGGTLDLGLRVLVLTNAMQPMRRPRIADGLLALRERAVDRMTLRVSLDHHDRARHDEERGEGSFEKTVDGIDWLVAHGFHVAIAGRSLWRENREEALEGYQRLSDARGWSLDARDTSQLVIFPEMDGSHDVPEITEACWGILGKSTRDVMCASSRMVVKRKGADRPVVLPCTLLPYESRFEMGETLAAAAEAHGGMFDRGAVKLCHAHCAKFCVLGGGSCS